MDALQPEPTRAAGWIRWLPGIATLRSYQTRWLVRDLGAGLVLTTALAPVGIAYAVASGLPGACGLYATIVPLLAYALFGPSRILVLGPDSSLAAIILGVVAPLAAGDANRAVALAGMMAIVSGAVCILAGVVRLGFVTELLSKPIRYGYMNGIALAVLVSQMPKLIGVKIEDAGPLRDLWSIAAEVVGGRANWAAFALGAATLATILSIRSFKGTPGVLIAVIGATAIVQILDLETRAHVSVLGPLPSGLPAFSIPWVGIQDLTPVVLGGLAVAVVSFADTSVLSRAYGARLGDPVDPNQEMIGLGAAKLAAGFFQGFPISTSSSRTPVAEAARARTQLTGVVGAVAVALLLLVVPASWRISPMRRWPPSSLPRRSDFSRSLDLSDSIGFSAGSSGCPSSVSQASPSLARSPASVLPSCWRSSNSFGTPGGHIRPCGRRERLSRHHPLSPCAAIVGYTAVSVGRAAVLRQRGVFQGTGSCRGGLFGDQSEMGGRRSRAGHQCRRHCRRLPRRAR